MRITVLFIVILTATSMLRGAGGSSPSSGIISTTNPTANWQGNTYTAVNADPSTCPPSVDTGNVLCDHFSLNINLAPDFWTTHTGTVTITIQWASGSNDFDLYIYRQSDGQLVGSSTLGGGETQEQVVLVSPIPGAYEARITPFQVVSSSYTGIATLAFTNGGPVPNPTFPNGGINFAPATIVDSQRAEGEPLVHIDAAGNIWESGPWGASTNQGFIAKSTDHGDSFHNVSPDGLRPNIAPGGGDSDIITDDQGFAYFADLEGLGNVGVGVTNDGGNTWKTQLLAAQTAAVDRQWLAVDNGASSSALDNTVFLTYRQIPLGSQILSSPGSTGTGDPTGGFVFTNAGVGSGPQFVAHGAPCGRLIFDPVNRTLYLPCLRTDHVEITRAYVRPGQRTGLRFTNVEAPVSPGGAVGHLFASLTTDSAGNVYVVWVDTFNNNVYLTSSTDHGSTWSTPLQVNGDPANTNVMPWAVAGKAGTADIVFYGTSFRGDPNSFPSWRNNRQAATGVKWFAYFVQVQSAASSSPTIYQVQASEHPMDYGQICTQGLNCDISGGDRTLADFFSLALDANGAARIVINDLTNQHHGAALFELTQVAGPSAIGTTLVPAHPNIDTGVTDPAGDAQVPHYSPAGAGPNQPALDLRSIQVARPDATHLTITLRLASLASLLPPVGANGIEWLTRWQFRTTGDGGEESYRIFYVGANSTAGQTPTFFAGTGRSAAPTTGVPPGNGCVTTTPQNCKLFVYPNEKLETGRINTVTGTISITVPLADIGNPVTGDTLFSVTALTFGYLSHQPILQDADATRAFDYVLAAPSLPGCDESDGSGDFEGQQHGTFSFDEDGCQDGDQDSVQSTNRGDGRDFQSTRIDTVRIDSLGGLNMITITGVGVSGGLPVSFIFEAIETGPTTPGWVSLAFSDGYTNAGNLINGNIQLH
jgi:hypothetical protein